MFVENKHESNNKCNKSDDVVTAFTAVNEARQSRTPSNPKITDPKWLVTNKKNPAERIQRDFFGIVGAWI